MCIECVIPGSNEMLPQRSRYIVAQILGAYVACLFVYVQYHDIIKVGPNLAFWSFSCANSNSLLPRYSNPLRHALMLRTRLAYYRTPWRL